MASRALTIKLMEFGPMLERYVKAVYPDADRPRPSDGAIIRHLATVGLKSEAEKLPRAQRDKVLGVAAGKK